MIVEVLLLCLVAYWFSSLGALIHRKVPLPVIRPALTGVPALMALSTCAEAWTLTTSHLLTFLVVLYSVWLVLRCFSRFDNQRPQAPISTVPPAQDQGPIYMHAERIANTDAAPHEDLAPRLTGAGRIR